MTNRSVFSSRHFSVPPRLPLHSGLSRCAASVSLPSPQHRSYPAARSGAPAAACGRLSEPALKPEHGPAPDPQAAHPALLSPQHPRGGGIGALHQPSPGRWQCLPADSSRSSHGCGSMNPTTASDRLVLPRNTLSSAFAQPLLGKVALKKKLDVWRLGISSGTSLWHPESWRSACALPCNGSSLSLLQGQTACPPRATPCSSHFGIGTCTGHKAG